MKIRNLPGLSAVVDEVTYAMELESPPEKPFRFIYHITIRNESAETVTIRARKWVVREENGESTVIEGDGVVGKFPRLEPGESFSYNSTHIVATDAVVDGAYFGTTESGEAVFTRIPTFRLTPP
jgi:ApaG protein